MIRYFSTIQSTMSVPKCSTCNMFWRNQEQLDIHQRHSNHGNYGMDRPVTRAGSHRLLAQLHPLGTTPIVQMDPTATSSTMQPTISQPDRMQPTTSYPIRPLSQYVNGQLVSINSNRLIPVAVVAPYDSLPIARNMRQSTLDQRVHNTTPPHNVIVINDNSDNQTPGTSSTDIITLD